MAIDQRLDVIFRNFFSKDISSEELDIIIRAAFKKDSHKDDDYAFILDIISMLGYNVTYNEVENLLKGKERYNIELSSEEPTGVFINTKDVREGLRLLMEEYGYLDYWNDVKIKLDNMTADEYAKLQYQLALDQKKYHINRYDMEYIFSECDLFGLKENCDYDNIVNSNGVYYFRVLPKKENRYITSRDRMFYEGLYKLVEYNGCKYLVSNVFEQYGGRIIIYVPENIFKKEFIPVQKCIKSLKFIGKRAKRKPIDQIASCRRYRYNVALSEENLDLFVLYKNSNLMLCRPIEDNMEGKCVIKSGGFYLDEIDWIYEETDCEIKGDISDALLELKYPNVQYVKKP